MLRRCAITLAVATAASCASQGDEVLLLLRNQLPGTGCLISASENDPFVSQGTIDTAAAGSGRGYVMTPLVANTTTTDRATELQRTIIIQGADIDLSFPDTALFDATELQRLRSSALTRFRVRFAGSVKPNGGTASFGFEVVPAELIREIATKLGTGAVDRTLVMVQAVVFGEMGGGRVESQKFSYPVTVCRGCLVGSLGACASLPSGTDANQGGACNPFQDEPVDCCELGTALRCPATTSGPQR